MQAHIETKWKNVMKRHESKSEIKCNSSTYDTYKIGTCVHIPHRLANCNSRRYTFAQAQHIPNAIHLCMASFVRYLTLNSDSLALNNSDNGIESEEISKAFFHTLFWCSFEKLIQSEWAIWCMWKSVHFWMRCYGYAKSICLVWCHFTLICWCAESYIEWVLSVLLTSCAYCVLFPWK